MLSFDWRTDRAKHLYQETEECVEAKLPSMRGKKNKIRGDSRSEKRTRPYLLEVQRRGGSRGYGDESKYPSHSKTKSKKSKGRQIIQMITPKEYRQKVEIVSSGNGSDVSRNNVGIIKKREQQHDCALFQLTVKHRRL